MCGISAVLTKNDPTVIARNMRIARALLVENETRGNQSTGLGFLRGKKIETIKDTEKASLYIVKHRKKINRIHSNIILGHTRYGTTGANTVENAHPFTTENIMLVHNGVISNHKEMADRLGLKDYNVDSEIFVPIFERGQWKMLAEVQGSASLLVFDKRSKILYTYRHSNPLEMTRDSDGIYFSSLPKQLLIESSKDPVAMKEDELTAWSCKTLQKLWVKQIELGSGERLRKLAEQKKEIALHPIKTETQWNNTMKAWETKTIDRRTGTITTTYESELDETPKRLYDKHYNQIFDAKDEEEMDCPPMCSECSMELMSCEVNSNIAMGVDTVEAMLCYECLEKIYPEWRETLEVVQENKKKGEEYYLD